MSQEWDLGQHLAGKYNQSLENKTDNMHQISKDHAISIMPVEVPLTEERRYWEPVSSGQKIDHASPGASILTAARAKGSS